MRYALVDNSTLTGIQRLLGQVPIKNKLVIDMDVLCLESLLQAILFYDRIIMIDDYKESYRVSRHKAFPELMPVGSDVLNLDQLLSSTQSIASNIVPCVEAGRFTDGDFKPFFELLKMHTTFTWDMSGSAYFLTQKILAGVGGVDVEKYSRLSSAIYSELLDRSRVDSVSGEGNSVTLLDHKGQPITSGYSIIDKNGESKSAGVPHLVAAFFDGLNWLAFRTIFYTLAANNLGVDLFLHPIRQAFQPNFLVKLNQEDPSVFKPLIDAMNDAANTSINTISGKVNPFVTKHQLPLFVRWFAEKVGSPDKYIEYAYQLRQEQPFVQARQRLITLEECVGDGTFTSKANNLILDVSRSLEGIVSKYGASTSQGVSLSSLITLWNIGAMLKPLPKAPNVDLRIKQLEFMKHLIPQKGFKAVYRSVVGDLSQVSRLGKYHEVVSSKVVLDENASEYFVKEEAVRFARMKSGWKVPM